MKKVLILIFVLAAALLAPVNGEVQHTIQFQDHCSYPVWVDITGGLQYKSDGVTVGACGCLPDGTCSPTTMCNSTGCGKKLNKCDSGTPLVAGGGFKLEAKTGTQTYSVPLFWQGAFWGRTNCVNNSGDITCDLGTCRSNFDGKGKVQCGGVGGTPPMTKGEINFDQNGGDTYDVSIVDGFNVPMTVEVVPGTGDKWKYIPKYACTKAGNSTDILPLIGTSHLSENLKYIVSSKTVAMWSACSWASPPNLVDPRKDEYCCINKFGTPGTCDPTKWPADLRTEKFFKMYSPESYSFAYSDATSTFQCRNKDADTVTKYIVTFCGANEGDRIYLPGSDEHTHIPDMTPTSVPIPSQTPVPVQTPVTGERYNPATSGQVNF